MAETKLLLLDQYVLSLDSSRLLVAVVVINTHP